MLFRKTDSGVPDECRTHQLCVVKIANDGPMMVKELPVDEDPVPLQPVSHWNAEPIEDVALDWAAKVMDIRPHSKASPHIQIIPGLDVYRAASEPDRAE